LLVSPTALSALPIEKPSELLENPFVVFLISFAVFFAALYFSLGRVFRGNLAIPAIIAAGISFVIAAMIEREWQLLQKPVSYWIIILILLLVFIVFFFFISTIGGPVAGLILVSAIYASWPLANIVAPKISFYLPHALVKLLWDTWWIALVLCIVLVLYFSWRYHKEWKLEKGLERIATFRR
jgi:hypothetical protein